MPLQTLITSGNRESTSGLESNPDSFLSLPKEIQKEIIMLLASYNGADSLEDAAKNIQSLSFVNKEMNALINDPQFCLQIVRNLATKFQCPEQTVCEILKTPTAQQRLNLQMNLFNLCLETNPSKETFESLYEQGADLEFTYDYVLNRRGFIATPLMLGALSENTTIMSYLLAEGVSINKTNVSGLSALMIAAKNNKTVAIKFLCNSPHIAIDQQNELGNTALMISLMNAKHNVDNQVLLCIQALILAGASLDIANNNNVTPRTLIEEINNTVINGIVEKALAKKE